MEHITDNLYRKKWGVFNHFLAQEKMADEEWCTCVNNFDTELVAKKLHEMGAGYYFITIMQGTKYMCAPNMVYDEIAGVKPGEACAQRDLIEDLYQSLSKYDIDLYLYYTGDGPWKDEEIGKRFGYNDQKEQVTEEFVRKWSAVLEEYAVGYGDKVKGWWIDGCYDYFGYNDELLKKYYDAVKKGNPRAIVAFNNAEALRAYLETGKSEPEMLKKWCKYEEYTSGEMVDFILVPEKAFIDGARAHLLIPLGIAENGGWCQRGIKRDREYLKEYVRKVNQVGGVVTIDIFVDKYGRFDEEQMQVLKGIGNL